MKTKRVLSSLVLGAAMLTLAACDSGAPSVDYQKIADDSIKAAFASEEFEQSLEDVTPDYDQISRDIERISAEVENIEI